MEGIPLSSNQNQSKTLEESVRKALHKAVFEYALYLSTKGDALERVLKNAPQALPSLSKLIKNLEKFGECKSFLTNDPKTLRKCIDEYNFKRGILKGIHHYTIKKRPPVEIEEFIKSLEALANGGKQVIEDLYNLYHLFKTIPISKKDIDKDIFEIVPEVRAITFLIVRYLDDPENYGKKLSKYLGKKPSVAKYLSVLKEAFSKIPSSIGSKKAEIDEVEIRKELEEVIRNYDLYASSIINAHGVVIREALPSLATLIENLRKLNKINLLTNDPKILREYADIYYFMGSFMESFLEWSVSKYKHSPEEIERFKKGLEKLANGGEEIIEGLYKYYKEVKETTLKKMLKDKNYQTISPYEVRKAHVSARIHAGEKIKHLLMNYFRSPEEYEDQIMKYVVTLGSLSMKYVGKSLK
ncbi:MAG: hypothetical protein ACO2ON_00805 [Candidatus Nanopusillus sp.]